MRLEPAWLLLVLISASHQHDVVKRESGGPKRVVCYYTNWSVYRPGTAKFNPQNINPYLCTHLIYAFGGLDRENGLRPYDKYQDIEQGGYAKFTGLKTYNKALKTMLAIGGWNEGSARFSPLVADEERRKEFVKNVVKFLRVNHFDGLDLDWEYPAFRDGGKSHDRENYAQLVQELREEFERESDKTGRPRLLLTMAVPAGLEYIDKGYDIPKLNKYLDFMNILSYDYHSAFEPSVNHHSPLYSVEEESEYNFDTQLTIDATIKHYLLKGADADKLVLGIPTYGRSYTLFNEDSTDLGSPADGPGEQGDATREKGYLAYYEICANVKNGWTVVQPKETAMGPYAYKGNQWVGYDDENIARRKSKYVLEKNLGGIMFWSIDNDDFRGKCHSRAYPLIEAAKEALMGTAGQNSNKLPSAPRGGKTSSKLSSKLKNSRSTTSGTTLSSVTLTTPDPPTTPDPGSDFVCKDEGFYPHPRDCKKYFWCLDSGPSNLGIVAHQFTCPSGLFFNKAADSCDFARNVICKKNSGSTTTTTAKPTTKAAVGGKATTVRTTTTTSTTTEAPVEEEEYYEEEEDPQTIKQLISLIKKLGGVAELEKQLEGTNSGPDTTTPAISKSLYERVISKQTPKYQTFQRNGPTGPQNEGLARDSARSNFRKDKPQYVTIRRERPSSTESSDNASYEVEEEDEEVEEKPKYTPIQRNRGSQREGLEPERSTERYRPKYQTVERFRPKLRNNEKQSEEDNSSEDRRPMSSTLRYTNILRSRSTPASDTSIATTSRYVTLQRQRPHSAETEDGTTENELDEEDITEERVVDVTTTRPRIVKVSDVLTTTPGVRTSTRIVTRVVEGPTQRQRVPLHLLQQYLKESENSIETVTKPYAPATTEEPKSILRTRRPIIVTSTIRSTPAYIALRRNRFRGSTAEAEVTTKPSRFVPSRTRGSTTVSPSESRFSRPKNQEKDSESSTQPSQTPRRLVTRGRFQGRRSTTESTVEDKSEEPLFSREYSRETNVIRRPVLKPRFPPRTRPNITTTTTTTTSTESPSSSTTSTVEPKPEAETTSPTTENATLSTLESTTASTTYNVSSSEVTPTEPSLRVSTHRFNLNQTRRIPDSHVESTILVQNQTAAGKPHKRVVVHRKKLEPTAKSLGDNYVFIPEIVAPTSKPRIRSRGKAKFSIDEVTESVPRKRGERKEENFLISPTPEYVNKRTTPRPEVVRNSPPPVVKQKKILVRGRKKYREDGAEVDSTPQTPRNGTRRVLLRKTVKDLARGESSLNYDDQTSRGSVKVWDSLQKEDLEVDFSEEVAQTSQLDDPEIKSRGRRPYNRRTSTRFTTTTTEVPTTSRQRTTAQTLKQRLNRFKTERNQVRSTTPSTSSAIDSSADYDVTTPKPRRPSFRRVIRPSVQQQSLIEGSVVDSNIEQSVAKDTLSKSNHFRRDPELDYDGPAVKEEEDYSGEVVHSKALSRGEPHPVTVDYRSVSQEEHLPDLANVAVAAIQSLATSAPVYSTQQITSTTSRPPTTRSHAGQRSRTRPTRQPTYATTLAPPVNRGAVRSSPRPFSKTIPIPRNPDPTSYDDYEEYYVEPVDVPLSGKVRIHNDGYIECLDMGNFPHPFSCRKFISCAKMENGHLLGWEYTCPKGLSFDPIGGICNWNAGLGCKE